ncbi:hypothetical protein SAMN05192574_105283 [Mucilaginibacter gossypiicola]|uniref:DUF4209 domain-containing protein n=2 Tax=Mucilaginibacter gossypiicola TaxID=551995 RepID=A0A1H8LXD5_9SPHI|nr:hypothetical protein SAMN05192574_105283 [Mucilaginibacter gossypiicola]
MDMHARLTKDQLFDILQKLDSPFVPTTRLYIYTEGLGAGFENNFIMASHFLLPQIENSLRVIADLKQISVTNFRKPEQFENTFGRVLEKLAPDMNADLYAELQSFFLDSTNVNFRNELLHGLIDTASTQHFGYYAWWLSLKLIYFTNTYFSLGKTENP